MGGARACALRVAVRCDARVEAGTRGLAAGRARASFAMGLRILRQTEQALTYLAPTPVKVPYREFEGVIMCEGTGRGMSTPKNDPKARSHRRGTHKS